MERIKVKEYDKRYNRASKYNARFVVLNLCIAVVSFVLYLTMDFNPQFLILAGVIILFRIILRKMIGLLFRRVVSIHMNKSVVFIEFRFLNKTYSREFKKSGLTLQFKTRRGPQNVLIGFELILFDSAKKRYYISDVIFDLIELEEIYLSLKSGLNVVDEQENQESLKQIQFQTLLEKEKSQNF